MNKILIIFFVAVTAVAYILVFPVQAEETLFVDVQTVVENPNYKESLRDPDEDSAIDNDRVIGPEKNLESFPPNLNRYLEGDLYGKESFSQGNSLGRKESEPVIFFVSAVGFVLLICMGVYFCFFHWFLQGYVNSEGW